MTDGHAFGGSIETVVRQKGSIVVKTSIFNIYFLDAESYQPLLTFFLGSCLVEFYHALISTPHLC